MLNLAYISTLARNLLQISGRKPRGRIDMFFLKTQNMNKRASDSTERVYFGPAWETISGNRWSSVSFLIKIALRDNGVVIALGFFITGMRFASANLRCCLYLYLARTVCCGSPPTDC